MTSRAPGCPVEETDDPVALKKQIAALTERVKALEENGASLIVDDLYEYLAVARTKAMNEKISDALAYTREAYDKLTERDNTMKKILSYFEGRTVRERKNELFRFIKNNPVCRTADPELVLQRLRYIKKYGDILAAEDLPQTPLKDAIDRSNTPLPIPDPKDEDFLS